MLKNNTSKVRIKADSHLREAAPFVLVGSSMQLQLNSHRIEDATIVIVDDLASNVDGFRRILEQKGFGICLGFDDPIEAQRQFADIQPDLLILDWHMERLSGDQFLQSVAAAVGHGEMPPVLVVTADPDPAVRVAALAAGASDFVSKPLDPVEVLFRIRNLLQTRLLYLCVKSENSQLSKKVDERTDMLRRSVAELRELQLQIIQQERLRALGSMASGVVHDFNNELTVILGYTEMFQSLQEIRNEPRKALECFDVIHTAATDASKIVSRLREFYRPPHKSSDVRQMVDVNDVIDSVIRLSKPKWESMARGDGADIELRKIPGDIPQTLASPSELREMIMNLIFNAVDAMPRGGCITLRSSLHGKYILIAIEDTGSGMTEETRRRCLEPFYTTKGENGTGLGLSIIHGIVRRHNGVIRVASEINAGATISILLPIVGAPAPAELPGRAARLGHPLHVLVVDDQPEVCKVIANYLERDQHTVVTAASGPEALRKFKRDTFDVVITDQSMPKMNGEQLASTIKQINPMEPVILLTALDQHGHNGSADVVIDKPVSQFSIRDAIDKALAAAPAAH